MIQVFFTQDQIDITFFLLHTITYTAAQSIKYSKKNFIRRPAKSNFRRQVRTSYWSCEYSYRSYRGGYFSEYTKRYFCSTICIRRMEKRNISPSIYLKVVQIGWRSASLLQFVAACCDMSGCWSIVVFAWQIIFWRFLLCFGFKKFLRFLIEMYIVMLRIDELVNNKLGNTALHPTTYDQANWIEENPTPV